jgi:transposase-like protein
VAWLPARLAKPAQKEARAAAVESRTLPSVLNLQETLEAEMAETLGAEKGKRTEARLSYRSGYYTRSLITPVGTIELKVPQDRQGRFSTERRPGRGVP